MARKKRSLHQIMKSDSVLYLKTFSEMTKPFEAHFRSFFWASTINLMVIFKCSKLLKADEEQKI